MPFAWGAAGRPLVGEIVSGDAYLVQPYPEGLLLAVIDGLGHGTEAAIAATAAVMALEGLGDRPIVEQFERCNAALRDTRGVAMTVAHACEATGEVTWLGVGNVEGLIARIDEGAIARTDFLMLRNGVVGMKLPRLLVSSQRLEPGDLLIMATDGIRARFHEALDPTGDPHEIAQRLLEEHARDNDDAMVLVARYEPPERP